MKTIQIPATRCMKRCEICGSGPGYEAIPKTPSGYTHRLCHERKKLGLPTPPIGQIECVEAKVFQGQAFEKVNGQWKRVL